MSTKQVIVVRKDLNMRKGKIAAQVAHASMGAFFNAMNIYDLQDQVYRTISVKSGNPVCEWLSKSFTKICVSVDSEQELLDLEQKCKDEGILHCLITDNGTTEFNGVPTITCLAVGPDWNEEVDKITKGLPLL